MKIVLTISALIFSLIVSSQHIRNEYYSSGEVRTIQIIEGSVVSFTTYYKDGTIMETGAYYKNMRHGKWMVFSEDGSQLSEGHYSMGRKLGVWNVKASRDETAYQMRYRNGLRVEARKLN